MIFVDSQDCLNAASIAVGVDLGAIVQAVGIHGNAELRGLVEDYTRKREAEEPPAYMAEVTKTR